MELTEKEQAVVSQMLTEDVGFYGTISIIWPYLIPLVFAASYTVFNFDIFAISVTFLLIFSVIVWYLYQSGKSAKVLQSALRKYVDEVNVKGT